MSRTHKIGSWDILDFYFLRCCISHFRVHTPFLETHQDTLACRGTIHVWSIPIAPNIFKDVGQGVHRGEDTSKNWTTHTSIITRATWGIQDCILSLLPRTHLVAVWEALIYIVKLSVIQFFYNYQKRSIWSNLIMHVHFFKLSRLIYINQY